MNTLSPPPPTASIVPSSGRTTTTITTTTAGAPGAQRCCVNCRATQTPLWRRSPVGPKTLCNACGVRMKKGRLAYADGKFHAVESPAALAKRRKAEAAARAAAAVSASRAAGRTTRAGAGAGASARVRKATVRRPRNKTTTLPALPAQTQAQSNPHGGLYFLLAAIEFVEAS